MKRYAQMIGVRPERLDEYLELHRDVWPDVLATIHRCNMRNYSIFLRDGLLFAYYEYVGDDHEADMAIMAADPRTREWWALTDAMQHQVPSADEGDKWSSLTEVFHID